MFRTNALRTVLIWTLLELIAAFQVRTEAGSPVLFSWMRTVAEPVVITAESAKDFAVGVGVSVRGLTKALSENRALRRENEELRARQALMQNDLDALREVGDLAGPDIELEAGSLLGRCAYRNLAAGTMEVRTAELRVLRHDTPVVSSNGLVGRVVRSDGRRHWLQLITHTAAAVAVQTEDATVQGLALGSGSAVMTVAYVPRQAELETGALLVTSGGDGIYPPGIPTARVTRVRESDDPFLEITAASSADLQATQVVLMLPAWAPAAGGDAR
jgi:rod shape-determining protein MreC